MKVSEKLPLRSEKLVPIELFSESFCRLIAGSLLPFEKVSKTTYFLIRGLCSTWLNFSHHLPFSQMIIVLLSSDSLSTFTGGILVPLDWTCQTECLLMKTLHEWASCPEELLQQKGSNCWWRTAPRSLPWNFARVSSLGQQRGHYIFLRFSTYDS